MYAPRRTTNVVNIKPIWVVNKPSFPHWIKMITESQKAHCVRWFHMYQSATIVQRKFRTKYKTKKAPDPRKIKQGCAGFIKDGNMLGNRKNRGTQDWRRGHQTVDDHFRGIPKCSIRQAARALGMKKSTVHNVVKNLLKLWSYKFLLRTRWRRLTSTPELCLLKRCSTAWVTMGKILFTDEATCPQT